MPVHEPCESQPSGCEWSATEEWHATYPVGSRAPWASKKSREFVHQFLGPIASSLITSEIVDEASTPLTCLSQDFGHLNAHPDSTTQHKRNFSRSSVRSLATQEAKNKPSYTQSTDALTAGSQNTDSEEFGMFQQKFVSSFPHGREFQPVSERSLTSGQHLLYGSPESATQSVPEETSQPPKKRSSHQRASRSLSLHRVDKRFDYPRPLPKLSRWDPRRDDPDALRPCCNPSWLLQFQKRMPWYLTTVEAGGGPWLSLRSWDAPYQFFTKELLFRWNNRGDRWLLFVRMFLVSILILVLFIVDVAIQGDLYAIGDVRAIYDAFHDGTSSLNNWIRSSEAGFTGLLSVSSFLMDCAFLLIWFQWIIIGDSMRLPIAYGLLYGIRALMRPLCLLPFPEGYVWRAPQFGSIKWPSLTVPYQESDDFFFSGHIGCGVLASVEHFYYRCWWGMGFSIFVTLVQVFIMTVTRGHYVIDMIVGAIVASWVHMLAQSIAPPLDQWLCLPPRPIVAPTSVKTVPEAPQTSQKDVHLTTHESISSQTNLMSQKKPSQTTVELPRKDAANTADTQELAPSKVEDTIELHKMAPEFTPETQHQHRLGLDWPEWSYFVPDSWQHSSPIFNQQSPHIDFEFPSPPLLCGQESIGNHSEAAVLEPVTPRHTRKHSEIAAPQSGAASPESVASPPYGETESLLVERGCVSEV